MSANGDTDDATTSRPLARLLEGLPVTDRRLDLAGISTSLLEGGEGPPIVLLHGQGGFAAHWVRVIPHLAGTHRVVAPDLPGLGESEVRVGRLDVPGLVEWLGGLIAQTCREPPTLVGISVGGALAARFAITYGDRVRRIVLVGSGGLGRAGRHQARWSRSSGTACAEARPPSTGSSSMWSRTPTEFGRIGVTAGPRSPLTT
jgi:pimeloyl-ACP methyl ester carboxylesterase